MYVMVSLVEEPTCQVKASAYVFERIETKGVLTIQLGDTSLLAETDADFQVRPNQPVWLTFDLDKIRVYDPATQMAIAP
jgi:hypothetical protein